MFEEKFLTVYNIFWNVKKRYKEIKVLRDILRMKITDINYIIESLKKYFEERREIELAYIFGSIASSKVNALSDIDIAILIDESQIKQSLYPYGYKAHVIADLMKLLKTNKVDLVILNQASPLLKHRVLYTGRLIYSRSERKRIQFQIECIDKYNDFKYLAKLY